MIPELTQILSINCIG